MATIKSYTDLQQSKKLAETLPIESADMKYKEYTSSLDYSSKHCEYPSVGTPLSRDIPCWSLASLLGVLPKKYTNSKNQVCSLHIDIEDSETPYLIWYANPEHEDSIVEIKTEEYSNPVDACYEMILKLNELKML